MSEQILRNQNGFAAQQSRHSLKIATTAILSAVGYILSILNPFQHIALFGAKINPFAHLINAIAGVLLGPTYAVICATIIATLRFATGYGSPLAFPGGISGALIVGLVRNLLIKMKVKRVHLAALAEPLGTIFIGAPLSSLLVQALIAAGTTFFKVSIPTLTWMGLFAASCIPGAIIGWSLVLILEKAGFSYHNYLINPEKPEI
jgi:energy coupling factor transporter S component ThiW